MLIGVVFCIVSGVSYNVLSLSLARKIKQLDDTTGSQQSLLDASMTPERSSATTTTDKVKKLPSPTPVAATEQRKNSADSADAVPTEGGKVSPTSSTIASSSEVTETTTKISVDGGVDDEEVSMEAAATSNATETSGSSSSSSNNTTAAPEVACS